MRVDRVEISNALCFRDLKLDLDPGFQVIAGANNAGKSSLVRLIEMFFSDPGATEMRDVRPAHDYYDESGSRILISLKLWFGDLSEADTGACSDAVRQDKRFWVALRCSRAGRVTYLTSHELKGERAREIYEYVLGQHHFAKIPSIRIGGSGDADRPGSLERLIDTLESILIRTGSARSTALQQQFGTKAEPVENLVKQVLDESATSIHSELPFQGGEVEFKLPEFRHALRGLLEAAQIESGEGAVVPLAERGTGFQSALVLGVLRYVAKKEATGAGNVFFAIEEPEAFLHPQTQRAMTQIIRSIAEEAQVLVTTHSPIVTDSVKIAQIARLPLDPQGTQFDWSPSPLEETEAGQLTRYCTSGNSELIFANAVILVEGFGDQQLIEYLLDRVCTDPGGHFARGVTVIPANGVGNMKHLLALADRFGVAAYAMVDKDGLVKIDGSRRLLAALVGSSRAVDDPTKTQLITLAEQYCADHAAAVEVQSKLNELLKSQQCFVLCSDLEGLVMDAIGDLPLVDALGPDGEQWLTAQAVGQFKAATNPPVSVARRIGSKGWNVDLKPTGKLDPHLPRVLVSDAAEAGALVGSEIDDIEAWLNEILSSAATTGV